MWDAEAVAARIGAERDGIVTGDDLRAVGVGHQAHARLRRRGVLVRIGADVSRLRDHPWTWRSRAQAALALAGPGAALGLRSAARLHGFYAYRDTDVIEVVVGRGRHTRQTAARLVQTRLLPPEHVTVVDGLRVTTIARTFFDLCGDPDHGIRVAHPAHVRKMARVYNDALARRGLRFVHEVAVLHALARRGRNGTALVRELLDRYGAAYEPSRSDTESLFVEVIEADGLPNPDKQVAVSGDDGFIGVVDFAWLDRRVVVEVDSSWHDGPIDVEGDAERDRRLRAAGYEIRRYRYGQLALRPASVTAELGALLSGRPDVTAPNSRSGGQ